MESTSFESRMHVKNPGVLQLYTFPTPNGIKVAAALEEIIELRSTKEDILYEPHLVNIRTGETHLKWFSDMFPSQKIPAIIDPNGPNGSSITMFESGAILKYLAYKYKELVPADDPVLKANVMSWLFWGSTTVSTQFKAFGFYYKYCSHGIPYCQERYTREVHRLLSQLDKHLASHGRHWVVGDAFTIADLSMWPWVHALFVNYDNAGELVFNIKMLYPSVWAWYQRCLERPASKRALEVCNINVDST